MSKLFSEEFKFTEKVANFVEKCRGKRLELDVHNSDGWKWNLVLKEKTAGFLAAFLLRKKGEKEWWDSVVKYEILLVNLKSDQLSEKFEAEYNVTSLGWGETEFISFDKLTGNEGFVDRNGTATFVITLRVQRSEDEWQNVFNFENANSLNNVCLVVETKELYVNKDILSLHSEFFKNMFFGDFKEKAQDFIELPDIKYNDFKNYLNLIYNNRVAFNSYNVDGILKLADRYQSGNILGQAEQFLITTTEFTKIGKLVRGDMYDLKELKRRIVESLTLPELNSLKEGNKYADFSLEMQSILFARYFALL